MPCQLSDCTRCDLRAPKMQNFLGGRPPRPPQKPVFEGHRILHTKFTLPPHKTILSPLGEFSKKNTAEYRRFVPTRWLCLEIADNRTLILYKGLDSMFASESENTPIYRFVQLSKALHLLFFNSAFPTFTALISFYRERILVFKGVYQYNYERCDQISKFLKAIVLFVQP